jgi:hypothetical protein
MVCGLATRMHFLSSGTSGGSLLQTDDFSLDVYIEVRLSQIASIVPELDKVREKTSGEYFVGFDAECGVVN